MRAAVRRFHSPDIDDLERFRPADADSFSFLLQIMIGPADGDAEESFDVVVCTPTWLLRNHERKDIIFGRHRLVVLEYDFERIRRVIQDYCARLNAPTWEGLAAKLARLGKWEFEDYSETPIP